MRRQVSGGEHAGVTTSTSSAGHDATTVGRTTGRRTRWTEVDGVPVVSVEAPGELSAGLVLGVGWRDEPYLRRGVTHLLEHLVMREVHTRRAAVGASVDVLSTEFHVSGSPDVVVTFLRRVCELLADPPTDHLALELDVLAAEEREDGGPDLGATLLAERFGRRRAGLAALVEPATATLDASAVREWAARWAVAGNACVWLSGPVPGHLALPLPPGRPPSVDRGELPVGAPLPARLSLPDVPVAVTAVVPHAVATSMGANLLEERLVTELRTRRGLVYDVDVDLLRLSDGERHLLVTAAPPEGREGQVVDVVRSVLRDLAQRGPSAAELAEEVEIFCEDPGEQPDPERLRGYARWRAECRVLGWAGEETADIDEEARSVRPEDVRDVFRAVERSALVVVPEETDAEERVADLSVWPTSSPTTVTGRTYLPRWWKGVPRRARLVVGEEGVTLTTGPDHRATVRWEDVLGLLEDDSEGFTHVLVGTTATVPLDGGDWRGGGRAMAEVLRHVPEHLRARADAHSASGHGALAGAGPAPG